MSDDAFKNLNEGDGHRGSLAATLGTSTLYNLLEAMVQLAERNQRGGRVGANQGGQELLVDRRHAACFRNGHPYLTGPSPA